MLKLMSGAWLAAEKENVAIRDNLRSVFWKECGLEPAQKMADIDLAPEDRLSQFAILVETTLKGKENDPDLAKITQIASAVIAQMSLGGRFCSPERFALQHELFSPRALREFFSTPDLTTFELNRRN